MQEEFLYNIKNNEYISTSLYNSIKNSYPNIIPPNFNLEIYNNNAINYKYHEYYDYFKNIYKDIDDNIILDEEQIKAILNDDDYTLIIAGAGTGKTTTMAAKVKYLVDKKHIEPNKILVMSFTRKATQELANRITIDFGIPANVTTFHSLGFKYIKELYKNNRRCYVVDSNKRDEIFSNYFKEHIFNDKNKVSDILNTFDSLSTNKRWLFGSFFKDNYDKYNTFDEYFESYIKAKKLEITDFSQIVKEEVEKKMSNYYTINSELVKSKGEALIANFLFKNNIPYLYEKLYEEFLPNNEQYKPDFTLNIGGQEIYIEYFGLSNYPDNLNRYNKIKNMKLKYHQEHKTKFIAIDYINGQGLDNIEETLKNELLKLNIKLNPKTDEEIYEHMLRCNPTSQFYKFKDLLYNIIDTIKANPERDNINNIVKDYIKDYKDEEKETLIKQFNYFYDFYLYYQQNLFGAETYGFDYSDMIYYANKYFEYLINKENLKCDYIIIDEYQDISQSRYELTKKIADYNHSKVVAVGDDWQSIYAFTGSKIEYIYNFQKLFPNAKLLNISKTYRNSQELINYSGDFIMKNPDQIKKKLISNKSLVNPIRFITYEDGNEYKALQQLILQIHKENPEHSILILARLNEHINNIFKDKELREELDNKITFIGNEDIDIEGMTIHKSKGLTSDEVIIIGLNRYFPREGFNSFWLLNLFKPKPGKERIPFPEERRLFYVGLTRTKNYVYLLVNKNPKERSPFLYELSKIIDNTK